MIHIVSNFLKVFSILIWIDDKLKLCIIIIMFFWFFFQCPHCDLGTESAVLDILLLRPSSANASSPNAETYHCQVTFRGSWQSLSLQCKIPPHRNFKSCIIQVDFRPEVNLVKKAIGIKKFLLVQEIY